MNKLTGTGVALATPFDENLRLDTASLARLVEHVTAGGVDFLVALGTTAESATLSGDEKREAVRTIVRANRRRLPVLVGVGGNHTAEVVREIRSADWIRECQGILSVTPFYNKPTQEGIYAHFKAIAEVSPLPLCLYNIPGRTGVNMDASTLSRLAADCSNIVAVKEASGNFAQATAILQRKPDRLSALSGDDAVVLPLMAMGFDGVISVLANVLPDQCAALVNAVRKGDYVTARRLHLKLADLCKWLFEEGNPAGVKAALSVSGIIRCPALRLPLTSVSGGLAEKIRTALQAF